MDFEICRPNNELKLLVLRAMYYQSRVPFYTTFSRILDWLKINKSSSQSIVSVLSIEMLCIILLSYFSNLWIPFIRIFWPGGHRSFLLPEMRNVIAENRNFPNYCTATARFSNQESWGFLQTWCTLLPFFHHASSKHTVTVPFEAFLACPSSLNTHEPRS